MQETKIRNYWTNEMVKHDQTAILTLVLLAFRQDIYASASFQKLL